VLERVRTIVSPKESPRMVSPAKLTLIEVPSNVILEKIGARVWIARIMVTWGILAGLTAMVTGSTSFAIVRFLLGVAEAGFFPGIILYFTYWFPSHHHARIVSGFLIGLPVAVAIGAPISTALLGLDGLFGLKGWQVMYIAEATPTLVIGVITFFLLTDRPEHAKFCRRVPVTPRAPKYPALCDRRACGSRARGRPRRSGYVQNDIFK
jgi:MFS family permease